MGELAGDKRRGPTRPLCRIVFDFREFRPIRFSTAQNACVIRLSDSDCFVTV